MCQEEVGVPTREVEGEESKVDSVPRDVRRVREDVVGGEQNVEDLPQVPTSEWEDGDGVVDVVFGPSGA